MVNRERQTATYIPTRRPSCRHYDQCLNEAARMDAYSLGCGGCDRYEPYQGSHEAGMIDSVGCWALVIKIFSPEPIETDLEPPGNPSEPPKTSYFR
ncbi:MAG: hypothetical protein ACOWWM_17750 [Desulfobacterales bacterium]